MKKQGFTLIELMVVIVIMGILAAVAVPKLFGQIAKSKASEVATNAGMFKTAVDAYVVGANDVSTAASMGYDLPGNTGNTGNFQYSVSDPASKAVTWKAKALVGLNNCTKDSEWKLQAQFVSSSGRVDYTWNVVAGTSGDVAECRGMTPGFEKLGTSGSI